jgi:hypothetical protein
MKTVLTVQYKELQHPDRIRTHDPSIIRVDQGHAKLGGLPL